MIGIRDAALSDARRILEIYDYYVRNTAITNCYACIAFPDHDDEYLTTNSADFHEHMGFSKVGEFHQCGYKFGRWYNMIWMERIIGGHQDNQAPVVRYPEFKKDS